MPYKKKYYKKKYNKKKSTSKRVPKAVKTYVKKAIAAAPEVKYYSNTLHLADEKVLGNPTMTDATFNIIKCLADSNVITPGDAAASQRIGNKIKLKSVQIKFELFSPLAPSTKGPWNRIRWHIVKYKNTPTIAGNRFPDSVFENYWLVKQTSQDQGLQFIKSGTIQLNHYPKGTVPLAGAVYDFVHKSKFYTINVNLKDQSQEYTGSNAASLWRTNIFLIMYAYASRQGVGTQGGAPYYWCNATANQAGVVGSIDNHPRVNYSWLLKYTDA